MSTHQTRQTGFQQVVEIAGPLRRNKIPPNADIVGLRPAAHQTSSISFNAAGRSKTFGLSAFLKSVFHNPSSERLGLKHSLDGLIFVGVYCPHSLTRFLAAPLRYAETLKLISRLPHRQPAATLPSRLDELFDKLLACGGPAEATRIEDAIWNIWMYDDHEGAELALERATADIAAGHFDIAETRLAILLRRRPDWAEAWNKLATLYYVLQRDDESVVAIHRTLEIEPRHFGAMCGFAEILRSHGNVEAACLSFNMALRVHPQLGGVRDIMREMFST